MLGTLLKAIVCPLPLNPEETLGTTSWHCQERSGMDQPGLA